VIAVSTYVASARWGPWEQTAVLVPLAYVEAVTRAGGLPVLIPPVPGAVAETLELASGVILCGGPDVDPSLYGAEREPATVLLAPERDGAERELIAAALERDVPLLGICRGAQLLNVVRGGTLHQDLPGHVTVPGTFDAHEVVTAPGSRVASILGPRLTVASGHHQGIDRVGDGLIVGGRAGDGTVEALEDPDRRFAVGVLWHPEQGGDDRLFEALIAAVRAR
jgi:putative glutamine amidotransferase